MNFSVNLKIFLLETKFTFQCSLQGIINPATREWKDGLFSVIMRDQAALTGDNPKWIILDGDIDPMVRYYDFYTLV